MFLAKGDQCSSGGWRPCPAGGNPGVVHQRRGRRHGSRTSGFCEYRSRFRGGQKPPTEKTTARAGISVTTVANDRRRRTVCRRRRTDPTCGIRRFGGQRRYATGTSGPELFVGPQHTAIKPNGGVPRATTPRRDAGPTTKTATFPETAPDEKTSSSDAGHPSVPPHHTLPASDWFRFPRPGRSQGRNRRLGQCSQDFQ